MKGLLIGLLVLGSASAMAGSYCKNELKANEKNRIEILRMSEITEVQRELMLSINKNSLDIILLTCGMKKAGKHSFCKNAPTELNASKDQINQMTELSDEQKSLHLSIIENAIRIVELGCP
jgi:hypothetical protein